MSETIGLIGIGVMGSNIALNFSDKNIPVHVFNRSEEKINSLIGRDSSGTEYSSKLSSYLSLGCLSPVTIYHEVKKYEKEVKKNSSTYWLIFEILWREFFRYVYLKGKNM